MNIQLLVLVCLGLWFYAVVRVCFGSVVERCAIGSKYLGPLFHPIRGKTKTNCDALAHVSRALRQLHVFHS